MSCDEQPTLGVEPIVQKALRASFAPPALDLWIEGVEPALSVRHVSIREQLSDLFSIAIIARSSRPDLDLETTLFQPLTPEILLRDEAERADAQRREGRKYVGEEDPGLSPDVGVSGLSGNLLLPVRSQRHG